MCVFAMAVKQIRITEAIIVQWLVRLGINVPVIISCSQSVDDHSVPCVRQEEKGGGGVKSCKLQVL